METNPGIEKLKMRKKLSLKNPRTRTATDIPYLVRIVILSSPLMLLLGKCKKRRKRNQRNIFSSRRLTRTRRDASWKWKKSKWKLWRRAVAARTRPHSTPTPCQTRQAAATPTSGPRDSQSKKNLKLFIGLSQERCGLELERKVKHPERRHQSSWLSFGLKCSSFNISPSF